jgi:hypothetical protein
MKLRGGSNKIFAMFIATHSTQFWYKHTMHLHVLLVSAYCGQQVHRVLQSLFFLFCMPPYTGHFLQIGGVLYKYVVYVNLLSYKIDYLLNTEIKNLKILKF